MNIGNIASQAFVPNKLDGLKFWPDPSDIATIIESSGLVSEQEDKSDQGNDAIQATSANKPLTGVSSIGGKNVITYDGVDDGLVIPATASLADLFLTGGTIVLVTRVNVGVDFPRLLDNESEWNIVIGAAGTQYVFQSDFSVVNGDFRSLSFVLNEPTLMTVTYVGSNETNLPTFYQDGAVKTTSVTTVPVGTILSGTGETAIGNTLAFTNPLDGDIGEAAIYDHVLSLTERNRVEKYFADKWEIDLFSPLDLVGLKVWLDASDISTIIASVGPVSEWRDKSPEGNHVIQTTMVNQPATEVDTINGLNVLTFDGVNDSLRIADFVGGVLSQPNTIYIVFEIAVLPSGTARLLDGKGGGTRHNIDILGDSNNVWGMQGSVQSAISKVAGFPYSISSIFNTVSSEGYINGVLEITGDVGGQTLGGLTLGAGGSTGIFPFAGKIAEVIVKDGLSDTAERLTVENYLFSKWGIGFSPLDLVGLKLWLDSSDITTIISDGVGSVSEWQDKSPEGNNVLQGTMVNQPATGGGTINGLNVLTFDGVNDFLRIESFTGGALSQPNTIYIVWEIITLPSVIGKLIDGADLLNIDRHAIDGARANDDDDWAMFAGSLVEGSPRSVGVPFVTASIFDGASSKGYLNGALEISGDVGSQDFGGITIGAGFLGTNTINAKIAEIVVKNGASDEVERLKVQAYLGNKWNIPTTFPQAFSSVFSEDFS